MEQKTKQFCNSVVKQLGELVREVDIQGHAQGFTDGEIRLVWKTIFEIMADKMKDVV